jgi:hypothetical protein
MTIVKNSHKNPCALTITLFAAIFLLAASACKKTEEKTVKCNCSQESACISPDSFTFGYIESSKEFTIQNNGEDTIRLEYDYDWDFVQVIETKSFLAPGEKITPEIHINRKKADQPVINTLLSVEVDNSYTIDLAIEIHISLPENKGIPFDVIDAQYDPAHDRIIMVSSRPEHAVVIYDPEDGTFEKVPLDPEPTCLYYQPETGHVAIGHEAYISYVNLLSMTVEKIIDIPIYVFDIVLSKYSWAYATSTWNTIEAFSVDLENNNIAQSHMASPRSVGEFDYSGDFMYLSQGSSFPGEIEKYDISGGEAVKLDWSGWFHDYPVNGQFWMSQDRRWIFTRGKCVYKTSDYNSTDLKPVKEWEEGHKFDYIYHASSLDKVLVIDRNEYGVYSDDFHLLFYDDAYFNYKGAIKLEAQYPLPPYTNIKFEARFVFAHSYLKKLYVLIVEEGDNGFEDGDWAVQTFGL